MRLDDKINILKNMGATRVALFNELGIYSIGELIQRYPRDYEDRSIISSFDELKYDESNVILARVAFSPEVITTSAKPLTRVRLADASESAGYRSNMIEAVWFNQPFLKKLFRTGDKYYFVGKVTRRFGKVTIESPEYEKVDSSGQNPLSVGHIVPIYVALGKISQKMMRAFIKAALDGVIGQFCEVLPAWMRDKYSLAERNFTIQNIHFPKDRESFFRARRRLVFEELLMLRLALTRIRHMTAKVASGIIITSEPHLSEIRSVQPFEYTRAQSRVIDELLMDMQSGHIMNRLVQGDVGSGKTAVAMAACYCVIRNGYQAALMAPTEVLAAQHYAEFQKYFSVLGIECALLTGSAKRSDKLANNARVSQGTAMMVIGTHAIIQSSVVFNNPGLVITDEQHRFGVRQRSTLKEKGEKPHVLVMTATPIPRTLALILYGDLDISIIDELPPGRQSIDTIPVTGAYRQRIYGFIKKEVDAGRQAYIICPSIEDSEGADLNAVITYTETLKSGELVGYRVDMLHGAMKPKEKQDTIDAFGSGEIQVLVSTTVVEVGVNVPNATIMVIENAERFGLAQLHQLRGRVGRGIHKSYCILISDSPSQTCKERMTIMKKTNDGFVISEKDLSIRGPGEFFGTMQHGLPGLKIANLYTDIGVLNDVQDAIDELYITDPTLETKENRSLLEECDRRVIMPSL